MSKLSGSLLQITNVIYKKDPSRVLLDLSMYEGKVGVPERGLGPLEQVKIGKRIGEMLPALAQQNEEWRFPEPNTAQNGMQSGRPRGQPHEIRGNSSLVRDKKGNQL